MNEVVFRQVILQIINENEVEKVSVLYDTTKATNHAPDAQLSSKFSFQFQFLGKRAKTRSRNQLLRFQPGSWDDDGQMGWDGMDRDEAWIPGDGREGDGIGDRGERGESGFGIWDLISKADLLVGFGGDGGHACLVWIPLPRGNYWGIGNLGMGMFVWDDGWVLERKELRIGDWDFGFLFAYWDLSMSIESNNIP